MTTTSGTEAPDAPAPVLERPDWARIAAGVAHQMARADFRRGDLAALRRMVPDDPGAAAFWRLMGAARPVGQSGGRTQVGAHPARHCVDDAHRRRGRRKPDRA